MSTLFDTIGSSIIAGLLTLMILNLNIHITEVSSETFLNNYIQMGGINSAKTVEYDLLKIGYRISGDKITHADSNKIVFWSDLSNSDTPVQVEYYLNSDSLLNANTYNPNDIALYRKVATDTMMIGYVSNFRLTYFNEADSAMNYSELKNNQTKMNEIRTIEVQISTQSADPSSYSSQGSTYDEVTWRRFIKPRNIIN